MITRVGVPCVEHPCSLPWFLMSHRSGRSGDDGPKAPSTGVFYPTVRVVVYLAQEARVSRQQFVDIAKRNLAHYRAGTIDQAAGHLSGSRRELLRPGALAVRDGRDLQATAARHGLQRGAAGAGFVQGARCGPDPRVAHPRRRRRGSRVHQHVQPSRRHRRAERDWVELGDSRARITPGTTTSRAISLASWTATSSAISTRLPWPDSTPSRRAGRHHLGHSLARGDL